ncbi:ATP-dependent DNA helicase [Acinetobacter sp. P1(2025)]|uniref:ATP-dependent DNA helicase n=1 Tax=Acinetobacter sp. P1(2025) TaxID=3446120 RepID=UPI003F539345
MNYNQLIDDAFSKDGIVSKLGGRYTKEQHEYANHVLIGLLGSDSTALSTLEAETGIGKTLGYLIPSLLLLNNAINEGQAVKPIVISTYTRSLQRQILKSDFVFACKILNELGIENRAKAACRFGRKAFFSITRVKLVCENLIAENQDPQYKQELKEFYNIVSNICSVGSGLITEYLEDYLAFPKGVSDLDICLLQDQDVDNDAYKVHLELAKDADLLITNHMTLINHHILGFESDSVQAVICDESHEILGICQQHFNYKRPLFEIKNSIQKCASFIKSKSLIAKAVSIFDECVVDIKASDSLISKAEFWTVESHAHLIEKHKTHVQNGLNVVLKIEKELSKVEHPDLKQLNAIDELKYIKKTLTNWLLQDGYSQSAIGFSDVRRNPSLATINVFAGRIFAKRISQITNNVILTSATLSDGRLDQVSFNTVCIDLGFKVPDLINQCKLAPSSYGEMTFVLSDPSNYPIDIEEDEVVFQDKWLKNTVSIIEAAKAKGGSVLVLCASFKEAKVLFDKISDQDSVLFHKKGTALNEYVPRFVSRDGKVLITPSGWEGLSLRDLKGQQLITDIVISRIPFPPPNNLQMRVIQQYMEKQGRSYVGLDFLNSAQKAVVKLKQGLGRGLRSPTDKVCIWFADGRMPEKNSNVGRNKILLTAISKRFLTNYANAEVFGEVKKEVFYL